MNSLFNNVRLHLWHHRSGSFKYNISILSIVVFIVSVMLSISIFLGERGSTKLESISTYPDFCVNQSGFIVIKNMNIVMCITTVPESFIKCE